MAPRIATIGAYGWTPDAFFAALSGARVDLLCDIRARRGVRGAGHAFANSRRIQARLAELGIRYVHRPELAPRAEIRALQFAADHEAGLRKRDRRTLTPSFAEAYVSQLAGFEPVAFLAELGSDAAVIALFCVESWPNACHRSLLAERLAAATGAEVVHLLPEAMA
jgi:uncharacterized protein (DUF488 family)